MSDFAFVFPGQGSQSVGMLDAYPDPDGVVSRTLEEASEALGLDLGALVREGPEAELNRTEVTQPAMLTVGVAAHRLWSARGGAAPRFMAGHSLGEYTALVAAGSLEFADAVRLVADRARFMQEAVPAGEGKMAALLGLDDPTVEELCTAEERQSGEIVRAVNFNAPGQVVVAGAAGAVDRLMEEAGKAGAKRAVELPVSIPSHCPLMQPAAERLAQRLQEVELRAPAVPVVNNVDVAAPEDPEAIRDALVRQLANPVRWTATIGHMRDSGVARVMEMGPGKVLCGLNKRIDRRMPCLPVTDEESLNQALEQAQQGDA
ncbi:malonyl CoA-ACP transacylase [Thiohalorhabdus denitrificans]|uniref:Malonyl CoA-acyl carrier protein transacylase n=1 Tax=Thiohalorhabdus denitrificans TaxID=381306 RepID=A0A0P9ECY6_9GAMM|nr:ACP S-malonyltransferase [Thiohalorhabdus denitrificans]KPV40142.1 malonyl CoA-ACP transacylase [Thiohalorhabdus denitrificans]SCY17505.1 [acyl-carrier-protein] S-malonyltransferase [Thiohalorhabdus denitrificans]